LNGVKIYNNTSSLTPEMDARAVRKTVAAVQIFFTNKIVILNGKLGFVRNDTMQRDNNIY